MKVVRPFSKEFDNKVDSLYKKLSKITQRKVNDDTALLFKRKYIWGICEDYWEGDINVWLIGSKYEKDFIKVCKKHNVDKIIIY